MTDNVEPALQLFCSKIGAGMSALVRRSATVPETVLISEDGWASAF